MHVGGFQKPIDPAVLDLVFTQVLEQLKNVNWNRGPHWLGAGAIQNRQATCHPGRPKGGGTPRLSLAHVA